jgi:hypothetical protein
MQSHRRLQRTKEPRAIAAIAAEPTTVQPALSSVPLTVRTPSSVAHGPNAPTGMSTMLASAHQNVFGSAGRSAGESMSS